MVIFEYGAAGTGYAVGNTITITQAQINSIGAWGTGASTAGDLVITLDSNMIVGELIITLQRQLPSTQIVLLQK